MSKISSIPFKSNNENLSNENKKFHMSNSKSFHLYHHIESMAISYLESKTKEKNTFPKNMSGVNSIYLNKTSIFHKSNSMNNIDNIDNINNKSKKKE